MRLEETLDGRFVIAGTGSRDFRRETEPDFDHVLEQLRTSLRVNQEAHPDLVVISGGAEGWDAWVASVALALGIPYVLCIPNKGYGDYYWRRNSRTGHDNSLAYSHMLSGALAIEYVMEDVYHSSGLYVRGRHSNFVRNDRMVELANAFVVYKPSSRGTADCLRSIVAAKKPYRVLG